jgi:hypothetical protein
VYFLGIPVRLNNVFFKVPNGTRTEGVCFLINELGNKMNEIKMAFQIHLLDIYNTAVHRLLKRIVSDNGSFRRVSNFFVAKKNRFASFFLSRVLHNIKKHLTKGFFLS